MSILSTLLFFIVPIITTGVRPVEALKFATRFDFMHESIKDVQTRFTSLSFQYPLKSFTLSFASYLFTDVEEQEKKKSEEKNNKLTNTDFDFIKILQQNLFLQTI